jgi:hypothetical protein
MDFFTWKTNKIRVGIRNKSKSNKVTIWERNPMASIFGMALIIP